MLSADNPAYDRLSYSVRHHRFTFRYFYGFLEAYFVARDTVTQRYMVGRGIEYSNHRNLVLGLAENSILTGVGRPIDLALLNPLAVHLEVEGNKRSSGSRNNNNATWSLFADWLAHPDWRVSASVVLDEIKLERSEVSEGKPDAVGYDLRLAWTPRRRNPGMTLFAEALHVGIFTYQHNKGENNFASRGLLLGYPTGNDVERYVAGARIQPGIPLSLEVEGGVLNRGENSLLVDPYRAYETWYADKFPSGVVRHNVFVGFRLDSLIGQRVNLTMEGQVDVAKEGAGSAGERYSIGLRYMLPFKFSG